MKRIIVYFLFVYLLFNGLGSVAQVAINADHELPDPSAMLDVSSSDRGVLISRMSLAERNAIASPAEGLLVFITDDHRFYIYNGTAWEKLLAGTDGGWEVSDGNIVLCTAGNVGIGTEEPSTDLEIADAGSSLYETAEARLSLYSDGASASPRFSFVRTHSPVMEDDTSAAAVTLDNDILGRISFAGVRINGTGGSLSGAGWIEMIQKGAPTSSGVSGQMRFVTSTGTGNRAERMVIEPDGKIGIGTLAPTNALHVYSAPGAALLLQGDDGWIGMELKDGAANQVGVFGFMNNGNGIGSLDITNRKTGGMISFYTEDAASRSVSAKMVINNQGQVGIGTTNPADKLEINGNVFLSGSEPMINFLNNSGTTDRMIVRKNPGSFGEINVLSNHELRLRTSDTDRVIIEEDGDIDMQGNQLKSFRIENRTSDPASPAVGQMWLRTDL